MTKSLIDILLDEAERNMKKYDDGLLVDSVTNVNICGIDAHEDNDKIKYQSIHKTKQVIKFVDLDVNRTYPQLNIFQTNGPLYADLRRVLVAYCCFRRDIGYVQGMSFIVGLLLLNMEAVDAFTVFCNLMNNPFRIALFTLREDVLQKLFDEFMILLKNELPKIYTHFENMQISCGIFLIDW
ncbi:hypothetical protein HZS_5965 [Henneguya salminicola]|nr:hypothetical protein HZS_5965 [Henneguya salminicola]